MTKFGLINVGQKFLGFINLILAVILETAKKNLGIEMDIYGITSIGSLEWKIYINESSLYIMLNITASYLTFRIEWPLLYLLETVSNIAGFPNSDSS